MRLDWDVPEELVRSTASILRQGQVIGTGWLLCDRHLITTADALGTASGEHLIAFADGTRLKAALKEWRPGGTDVAILELPDEAVGRYRPFPLTQRRHLSGPVSVVGLDPEGIRARRESGIIVGAIPHEGQMKGFVHFPSQPRVPVLPGAAILTPRNQACGLLSSIGEVAFGAHGADPTASVLTLSELLPYSGILQHHFYSRIGGRRVKEVTVDIGPPDPLLLKYLTDDRVEKVTVDLGPSNPLLLKYLTDYLDKIDYPVDKKEADEQWRKKMKLDLLQLRADKTEEAIRIILKAVAATGSQGVPPGSLLLSLNTILGHMVVGAGVWPRLGANLRLELEGANLRLELDRGLPPAPGATTAVAPAEVRSSPPLRYPHAAFYTIDPTGKEQGVPFTSRLSPPPDGSRLEFRFGFDVRVAGIPQQDPPALVPPRELPDSIRLRVDLWSEDFHFDLSTAELTLAGSDPSDVASFPLRFARPVDAESRAALFVFVRHETHLIAAFRVESAVAATPGPAEVPQGLQQIYLDNLWFRFERRALTAPAFTLYLRAEGERVQVFAFTRDTPTWGGVAVLVQEFQEKTRQVYLHITRLADRLQKGEGLPFAREGQGLCELGFQLFSDLFFSQPGQPQMRALAEHIRGLPAGAEVRIATEPRGRPFLLPWGLVYDGRLPEAASGGHQMDGFWGHRFKLTVCPSLSSSAAVDPGETAPARPRMATIYENRAQAEEMVRLVEDLKARGLVGSREELPIRDFSVPRLATDAFELLHFFCHGYTEIHDHALSEALAALAGEGSGLMTASSGNTRGSCLYTQRGTATLARLQQDVEQLRGRPIVLLSMCESAQVSSSGRSFVTFFMGVGARAVVGTEGPNPWDLACRMDKAILKRLLEGSGTALRDAVWEARRNEAAGNVLAMIYTVYGDGQATLAMPPS